MKDNVFAFDDSHIRSLVTLLLDGDDRQVYELIDGYVDRGASLRDVYLNLISGSASRLGEMWCEDECSFGDVTLGLAYLHAMIHHYRDALKRELPEQADEGSVFIASMPGDTHIFAAAVLEVFFTAAAWQCDLQLDQKEADLIRAVKENDFDIVCLSVSRKEDVDVCRRIIDTVRANRERRVPKFIVGGYVFINGSTKPEVVKSDGYAENPLQALDIAKKLRNQASA